MFPVTLEFSDGLKATCNPPCYGFLRGVEWTDWDQRFHLGSDCIKLVKRSRLYGVDEKTITEERPFGDHFYHTSVENGESSTPSQLFDLEKLRFIWNTGARMPCEMYINEGDKEPRAWRWPESGSVVPIYKREDVANHRPSSPLDLFNKEHGTNLTLEKVLTDIENSIDKGRESILRFRDEGFGMILGVSTLDVPCDRVLFYLMIGRELEGYHGSCKVDTFLKLHYVLKVPVMVAFLASRVLSAFKDTPIDFTGDNGDSCIVPAQNLWVGCAARFKEPVAIDWEQHSYTSGEGHHRDDDLGSFYMEPEIEGFSSISEEFNESMFNAIIGGYVDHNTSVMFDRPGGKQVANLVVEFYRAVYKEGYFCNRGSNGYCSYWSAECDLQTPSTFRHLRVSRDLWMDKLLSMLMEE